MRSRKCVVMSGSIAVAAMLAGGCGGSQPSGQPAPAPASANPPAAAGASAPTTPPTASVPTPPAAATPTASEPPATTAAPPTSAAAPAPTPTDQAGAREQVLASQPYNQNPQLRCDVLEVRRVSGGALLIRWRVIHPAAQTGSAPGQEQGIGHSWSWNGVYFTDPVENKKYLGLKDSAGQWLAEGNDKTYGPGDQQMMWMKFPAPPLTSNKISFVFPGFPPFEDLPVS